MADVLFKVARLFPLVLIVRSKKGYGDSTTLPASHSEIIS